MNDSAYAFMGAINSTKFIFPLIGLIEVITGVLLLAKKAIFFNYGFPHFNQCDDFSFKLKSRRYAIRHDLFCM